MHQNGHPPVKKFLAVPEGSPRDTSEKHGLALIGMDIG